LSERSIISPIQGSRYQRNSQPDHAFTHGRIVLETHQRTARTSRCLHLNDSSKEREHELDQCLSDGETPHLGCGQGGRGRSSARGCSWWSRPQLHTFRIRYMTMRGRLILQEQPIPSFIQIDPQWKRGYRTDDIRFFTPQPAKEQSVLSLINLPRPVRQHLSSDMYSETRYQL